MSSTAVLSQASSPPTLLLNVARWTLFPLVLAAAALGSWAIAVQSLPPMAVQMGVFAFTVLAAIAAERWLPFVESWSRPPSHERRTDLISWAVLMAAIDPLLKRGVMPLLLSLTVTAANPQGALGLFPSEWHWTAQLALAAVMAEFGQYWMHRAAHAQRWMWNVHSFHHSPPRLYWLNGFRVNPLNMAWHQLSGVFVLMLIGAPAETIHGLILFGTVISVFQHSNADLRLEGWNRVFATADLHRWHHDADTRRTVCNFGSVLMIWDQVFGTFRAAREPAPAAVGIADHSTTPKTYLGWLRHTTARPLTDR